MSRVIVLCGKIASGKTTMAKKIMEQEKAVILSIDDVMLKLYDGCLKEAHNQTASRIVDYFLTLIPDLLRQDISCILDYGFWTKEERKQLIRKLKEKELAYELIYLQVDDEVRKHRLFERNQLNAQKEGRQYIIEGELLERLDQRFEEPTAEEEFQVIEVR